MSLSDLEIELEFDDTTAMSGVESPSNIEPEIEADDDEEVTMATNTTTSSSSASLSPAPTVFSNTGAGSSTNETLLHQQQQSQTQQQVMQIANLMGLPGTLPLPMPMKSMSSANNPLSHIGPLTLGGQNIQTPTTAGVGTSASNTSTANTSTTSVNTSQKRKCTQYQMTPLSLKKFVDILWEMICDFRVSAPPSSTSTLQNGQSPATNAAALLAAKKSLSTATLNHHVSFYVNKIMGDYVTVVEKAPRKDDTNESEANHSSTPVTCKTIAELPYLHQVHVYLNLMEILCPYLETQNFNLMFPREMFKFYLATYRKFLNPEDFGDTNNIIKDRRSAISGSGTSSAKANANSTTLTHGSIILEFCKSTESFIANLSRSESSDVEALKFIMEKGIALPSRTYELIHGVVQAFRNVPVAKEITDKEFVDRSETHKVISISSYKRIFVLLTSSIVMQWDGHQFVTVTGNIEKFFNAGVLVSLAKHAEFQRCDYMILEVLILNKIKICDLVALRLRNENQDLPESYDRRLDVVRKFLPSCKLVEFQTGNKEQNDHSYIQKPKMGTGPTYVYLRSNITAAAVGYTNKHVLLAFRNGDELVYKTKVALCTPVFYTLATAPESKLRTHDPIFDSIKASNTTATSNSNDSSNQQQQQQNEDVFIMLKDKKVAIKELPSQNDIPYTLYREVIPVECREFNKITGLSVRDISPLSEYKPIQTVKNNQVAEFTKKLTANPVLATTVFGNYIAKDPENILNLDWESLNPNFITQLTEKLTKIVGITTSHSNVTANGAEILAATATTSMTNTINNGAISETLESTPISAETLATSTLAAVSSATNQPDPIIT